VSYGYKVGGAWHGAVAILDVSDPLAPSRMGTALSSSATGSYAYDVTVAGSRAFVAHGSCGLDAIDLVGSE